MCEYANDGLIYLNVMEIKMEKSINNKTKVIDALKELGGTGALQEIYDAVEKIYPNTIEYYKNEESYKAMIRDCLESHSSDSEKFKSTKEDLFYIVFNKGDGIWGLREYIEAHDISSNEELDTEGISNSKYRKTQGKFRRELLRVYNNKCPFTEIDALSLLVASHINPWHCDEGARNNTNNGIILSIHLDKLFDIGLISMSEDGQLLYKNDKVKTLIEKNFHLKNTSLDKKFLTEERLQFLKSHRKRHKYSQ